MPHLKRFNRSNPIQILTLNIRHGGGSRVPGIMRALSELNADLYVLTEFRSNPAGARIRAHLHEHGWIHQASSSPPARKNGVLIASRFPFATVASPVDVPEGSCRWLECDFGSFTLVGTYFPLNARKLPFWAWFIERARERVGTPCIFVGDFNTGKHSIDEAGATFFGAEYLDRMEELGYRDAWRSLHPNAREYTWHSHRGNGFRLDYAWLSPTIAPLLRHAEHVPSTRSAAITDHAGLLIDVSLTARDDCRTWRWR